jgi:hypothetical protein
MKRTSLVLSLGLSLALGVSAVPALAGGIGLSGAHYNLNIIGVENPKSQPLTDSGRHSIFVALGGKDDGITSKIYLTPGDFSVCDGNAFDAAYSCSGAKVAAQGAVFQLPCNTNVTADVGCAGGTASAAYEVWGRALGTPGGSVTMTTCATDDTGALICSTDNAILSRDKGKPTFTNVTQALGTLNACFDVSGIQVCETVSLFDPELQDFFWQYSNKGLRLAQLRFYLLQ